jgi:hypothetical protein
MTNKSLLTQIPENTSILQTTKFTFVFPNLPFARYFCQSVSIPGVSTTEVTVTSPFANTYRHGDKLRYDIFSINAIVDEDLRVWEETYSWLKALTKPTNFGEYGKTIDPSKLLYYDAILTINTNANNPTDALGTLGRFYLQGEETVTSDFIFCRARNAEFNYSVNPSFSVSASAGSILYNDFVQNPTTYISSVGMYNDNNELIAVAKLSKPLKKDFTKEALVRVKLDF